MRSTSAAARERGIAVTNTPDVLTDDVADLALGLMLDAMRGICGWRSLRARRPLATGRDAAADAG